MFLRATTHKKDGKEHRYWSFVENKRLSGGRVLQRHVLYLGEINSSQEHGWRKSIKVFENGVATSRTLSLIPDDRSEALAGDRAVLQVRLNELRLCRPRQWGACWLALTLWEELQLDRALTRLICYPSRAVASLICYPSDGPTEAEYGEADQHGNTQRIDRSCGLSAAVEHRRATDARSWTSSQSLRSTTASMPYAC